MTWRVWLLALVVICVAPRLSAETHPASAVVIRVDFAHLALQLSCQAIPGYMDAMVMTLPVHSAKEIKSLQPGMIIDFKLDVQKDAAYAEQIHVRPFENSSQEPMAARQLQILEAATAHPNSPVAPPLRIGEVVPNFALIDQNRQEVRSADFRGTVYGRGQKRKGLILRRIANIL